MTQSHPIPYQDVVLTDDDLFLFNEGSHFRLYEKLGSHIVKNRGKEGAYFAVWAPDAEQIFDEECMQWEVRFTTEIGDIDARSTAGYKHPIRFAENPMQ